MSHKTVLKNLILENDFKKVAEIGVCKGGLCRSVIKNCRNVLEQYWAIDPWREMGNGHGKSSRYDQERWDYLYYHNCKRMLKSNDCGD